MLRTNDLVGLFVAGATAFTIGCTGSKNVSPTAPTEAPPSSSAPSPGPPVVTMHGRVTESMPTTMTGVDGAVVKVEDGSSTPKSATTDSYGFYAVGGLLPGPLHITISADGYTAAVADIKGVGEAPFNFQLSPLPSVTGTTTTGTLSAQVGTCSDGVSNMPCNIVVFPVHNAGLFSAELTWTAPADGTLTMTLFQTGQADPMMRATSAGPGTQRLTTTLPGGADYELHLTYASGTAPVTYTLKVAHQT